MRPVGRLRVDQAIRPPDPLGTRCNVDAFDIRVGSH